MIYKPFTVALIGRPNVGKSTLFNRLIGRKLALVHDQPGVTRDRRYGDADLFGLHFQVIDTAGLADPDTSALTQSMYQQTQKAIDEAHVVLFMVDGRESCTAYDMDLAQMLRRIKKPVFVIANKAEGMDHYEGVLDAARLGLGDVMPISAEHGVGLDEVHDHLKLLVKTYNTQNPKPKKTVDTEDEDSENPQHYPLRLAIMGRPNVGKSTLVNALMGEERQLTGDMPGLTRDSIRLSWTYKGREIQLTDTAGMRRNSRIDERVERLSVQDARKALQFAECVVLVIDCVHAMHNMEGQAREVLEKQDLTIAQEVFKEGRAMVIALNKWDLVKDKPAFLKTIQKKMAHQLSHQLAQAKDIPFIGISAKNGTGLTQLMQAVLDMEYMWNVRIPTARLNTWLRDVVALHPAPAINGRRIRPKYITQAKSRPPTFVLFCSQAEKLPESYTRYLANSIREVFGIKGVPIRFWVRGQKNPYT